ncbi:dehydrogenase [Flexivirga endophytica]|uniref:Dehydrogenase n=1 Tax=Flexivirga endophytica TaxID=1849103 RepID=A0A916WP14_9MICO|nr:FAD binding domain-containing protein [Flexivirga endophytica]GGB20828.1 dehydrogenase [Flexivirga endophytica]GHB58663.1 dehydrogenase [Flexivirga endophytica]
MTDPASPLGVTVNGQPREFTDAAHTNLLDWLRSEGLTGAKEGCAEGECGACSVLVARPDGDDSTRWTALNACLVPAAAFAGQEIVTSEGLGSPDALHPVQQEMAVRGGSQCGYCTPGFVCSMAAEYYRPERTARPETAQTNTGSEREDEERIFTSEHGANGFDLHALSGNLCRCTGYRPIRDAAYALGDVPAEDPLGARCNGPAPAAEPTSYELDGRRFVRPASLTEALEILRDNPDAVPVAGCTDWGVDVNIKSARADLVVGLDQLPELRTLEENDSYVELGAGLTLSEIERALDGRIPLLDKLFPQFASRLIRNGATIGGNLGTGSPIGDTPPALLALDAELVLVGLDGVRVVPLADYFTGYRQTVLAAGELIQAVRIPLPLSGITAFHKIAKRRFDDISSVAIGYAIDVADGVVRKARIGLGGVAATPLRATAVEAALVGKPWTAETVRAAAALLQEEGTPMDDHRASSKYRRAMLGTSLRKIYAETASQEGDVA